jgi:hypothetical protein
MLITLLHGSQCRPKSFACLQTTASSNIVEHSQSAALLKRTSASGNIVKPTLMSRHLQCAH